MKAELAVSQLSVRAGDSVGVDIDVENTSDVIDRFQVVIENFNQAWCDVETHLGALFPDDSQRLRVNFNIPLHCPAGEYAIELCIVSSADKKQRTSQSFWLTVEPREEATLELVPSIVRGGSSALIHASVRNTGNLPTRLTVLAFDPTREVACSVEPSTIRLAQGERVTLDLALKGKRPWFGQPVQRAITVSAHSGEAITSAPATFIQRARIPRGAITAIILIAIVAVWAAIFMWGFRKLDSSTTPTKRVPADLADGRDNIPLATVSGSASGTVIASTTGAGLPRITVTASRYVPAQSEAEDLQVRTGPAPSARRVLSTARPSVLRAVAAVSTDESGQFTFPALVPGNYVFQASGPGYPAVSFPEPDHTTQPAVVIRPDSLEEPRDDGTTDDDPANTIKIVITGELTTMEGSITLPRGANTAGLTALARFIDVRSPSNRGGAFADEQGVQPEGFGSVAAPTIAQPDDPNEGLIFVGKITVAPDRSIADILFADLPTPGTYLVTIEGPGYDRLRFEQQLDGGQPEVFDTVRLKGADGTISGSVTDQNKVPLGGVTVTARAGGREFTVGTPTIANGFGEYTLADLPAPDTYVVTYELDGYASITRSLLVVPPIDGGDVPSINVVLVGGDGTIVGDVVDTNGAAIGGVEVLVVGESITASGATVTAGEPGRFRISDLPVSTVRSYVVTLSAPGLQTETVSVDFPPGSTGERSAGTITMISSTVRVVGTVTDSGVPIADVIVTLCDGSRARTTTSATQPRGEFTFGDVDPGAYTISIAKPEKSTTVQIIEVAASLPRLTIPFAAITAENPLSTDPARCGQIQAQAG